MTRRRRPRTRASDISRRQRSSLQQLVMAVVALIMLLLAWNHIASGAAGCFTVMSAGHPGASSADDARHDAGAAEGSSRPAGGIRVEGVKSEKVK